MYYGFPSSCSFGLLLSGATVNGGVGRKHVVEKRICTHWKLGRKQHKDSHSGVFPKAGAPPPGSGQRQSTESRQPLKGLSCLSNNEEQVSSSTLDWHRLSIYSEVHSNELPETAGGRRRR
jgi:hypothetical protein